jgi:DNA-binding transcriptional regulator YdaS (Cro superfamily)
VKSCYAIVFHSFVNVSYKGAALSFALENPHGAGISNEEVVQLISTACKVPAAKCSTLAKNFKDVAGQTLTLN